MQHDKDRAPGETQGEARQFGIGEALAVLGGVAGLFAAVALVAG